MNNYETLLAENLRLKAIILRGHDSHDCPNGTTPDGHCDKCLDPYWQSEGPKLQAKLFALEQELQTYKMWLSVFFEFMKTAPNPNPRMGKSPIAQSAVEVACYHWMEKYLKGIL